MQPLVYGYVNSVDSSPSAVASAQSRIQKWSTTHSLDLEKIYVGTSQYGSHSVFWQLRDVCALMASERLVVVVVPDFADLSTHPLLQNVMLWQLERVGVALIALSEPPDRLRDVLASADVA